MLATRGICRARMFYYSLVGRLVLYPRTRWLCTLLLVIAYIQNTKKVSYDVATYLIGFYLLQLILNYFTPQGIEEEEDESQFGYDYVHSDEVATPTSPHQVEGQ